MVGHFKDPSHPPMRTLGELGPDHRLEVSCPCVATVHVLSPGPLAARFGPGVALADLAARFRCKRCGDRRARVAVTEAYRLRQGPPTSRVVLVVRG